MYWYRQLKSHFVVGLVIYCDVNKCYSITKFMMALEHSWAAVEDAD